MLPDEEQLTPLVQHLKNGGRGLIVCGPEANNHIAEAVAELAIKHALPIFADPLSQLRAGQHDKRNIIENYDSLLKSESFKNDYRPDFIIRFGAMPVSKAYLKWIQQYGDEIDHFVVDRHLSYREPSGVKTKFIWADPEMLCNQLVDLVTDEVRNENWLEFWKSMNVIAKNHMLAEPGEKLNEGHAVVYLAEALPEESVLYVGNSMPIRDVDSFFMATPKQIKILANRGANGIDGVVSSAVGTAASGKRVTLLLGDLSFFHDMNGLLAAKQHDIPITIVVINNNGGGIFSYLPQVEHKDYFEELFGTPLGIDFLPSVKMYGGSYHRAENWNQYQQALADSYQEDGMSVVEVITNRTEHVDFHKAKWKSIEEAILEWRRR
ncbi:2-succinyl-5-enolpyruvyl-6-hydroxy-3-cyclohexene-1-carboxylate synthase [Halobacillus salinarum]|uniref:2-succinyl-5-enolpyruvyl-6-hydroxy-3- cyclohexene-1-carboxylate synthase n=1 Tax=Halobacillus salinarum TaxID=2932257 RepID=UPI0029621507|nr:thiamine pyrophosphate-dependent enzyme [Halobacillus salinarum]